MFPILLIIKKRLKSLSYKKVNMETSEINGLENIPDLRENQFFKEIRRENYGQIHWYIADQVCNEAKSPEGFLKVEISYRDISGLHTKMVYVIGHGYEESSGQRAIFVLDEWNHRGERRTTSITADSLKKFKIIV